MSFARAFLWLFVGLVLVFLILPNLVVIPMSFNPTSVLAFPPTGFSLKWYARYAELPGWIDSTLVSFLVAFLTTLISVSIGSLAAYSLVRGDFPGKRFLNALILLPIIVPTLVTAVAVFLAFSKFRLTGSIQGFVIAHSILAIPFVVTIMSASLRGIDPAFENAARGLGATRLQALRKVTLPMVFPGMISAALFAFLVSFDELLIALFLSSPRLATLPKKLWDGIRLEIEPTLAAVSTLLVVLSIAVLLGVSLVRFVAASRRGARGRT